MTYTNNNQLENLIQNAVIALEAGQSLDYVTQMIKQTPTHILKADAKNKEERFRPGSQLITYNGVTADGQPVQETWGGGVATLAEDSVILTNDTPLTYPEGHALQGIPVKGLYDKDGKFIVDQKNGKDTLRNEYVSDTNFALNSYNVVANTEWKVGYKMVPSNVIQIPSELEKVVVTTSKGIEINLHGGDYVIIDMKKGKVDSVHGIEKNWLAKTYVSLEEYQSNTI